MDFRQDARIDALEERLRNLENRLAFKPTKMKILRYELRKVISEGQEVIQVPYFSRPLDCLFEEDERSSCPVLYYGNEGGGKVIPVTIMAISERENRNAPYEVPSDFAYFGIVHSAEGELFFLFSSLTHPSPNPHLS